MARACKMAPLRAYRRAGAVHGILCKQKAQASGAVAHFSARGKKQVEAKVAEIDLLFRATKYRNTQK